MLRDPSWIVNEAINLITMMRDDIEAAVAAGLIPKVNRKNKILGTLLDLVALRKDVILSQKGQSTRSFDVKCQERKF